MRRQRLLTGSLAWLAAVAVSACRLLDPGLESYAERPWVEVRSPAFRVLSDAGPGEAQALCEDAELFRSVVGTVTNARRTDLRVPATIFVFASPASVPRFAGERWVAGLVSPGMHDYAAMVFAGRVREMTGRNVLFHEYTHLVMHNENDRIYPLWYEEGLAEFFSALRIEPERVVVGDFPEYRAYAARRRDSVSIRQVISTRSIDGWAAPSIDTFYFQAWLLTHYLTLGPGRTQPGKPSGLSRYLALEPRPGDEEAAWQAAFGSDFARLEGQLLDYGANRQIPLKAIPRSHFGPKACGGSRPVPEAEAARELGGLALRLGRRDAARALFEAALRADPDDARAHAGLGDEAKLAGRWDEAQAHYRRALELAPDDDRSHVELAGWAVELPPAQGGGTAEMIALAREHLAIALRLAPKNAEAHVVLAQTYLLPGQDPRQGVPHAQRAAQLLPANEQVQLELARVYLAAGERDAARRRLERLVVWSHPTLGDQATKLLAQLDAAESAPGDGHPGDAQRGGRGGAEP